MCTAMVTQTSQGDIYFGRTMDFSYPLEPELYVVPKGYQWNNIMNTHQVRNRYRFMGIGQDISPVVFADGVRSEEHTSELQSLTNLVCRLLLEKRR